MICNQRHILDPWPHVANTHTHTFNGPYLGLPGWAGTVKVKPIGISLKQDTVSGSGISWAICKSAPRSRQITTPAPHRSLFYRPDALPAAQPTNRVKALKAHKVQTRGTSPHVFRTKQCIDIESNRAEFQSPTRWSHCYFTHIDHPHQKCDTWQAISPLVSFNEYRLLLLNAGCENRLNSSVLAKISGSDYLESECSDNVPLYIVGSSTYSPTLSHY